MPFSRDSYQRLNTAKYGRVETDEHSSLQQTSEPDLEDDDQVGYTVNFTQPKDSFVGKVSQSCDKMRRSFLAALRFVLKVAFGKWPIALIILICYIAFTAGLVIIALTGKYHEFREDISLDSFMVPDIKVSSDFAAFNAAKEQADTSVKFDEHSFTTFLGSETCMGNKINPLPKQQNYPRRKRSTSESDPFYTQSPQRFISSTLDLVYVAKGGNNIFTEARLQEIHNIENLLMQHENFETHCFISPLSLKDNSLIKYGNCTPPNSMINFFYPSQNRKVFDGQGPQQGNINDTLQFLQSKKYFFSYVDDDFVKKGRSKILRAQILFGKPVNGIPSDKTSQIEEFRRYVRTYVDTLDNLNNNNQVSILYGGGDLFDYLVEQALLSDIRLASISLGLVVLLLLILTFSWWLSIMAVFTIVSSVAFAYFFYRVAFGMIYMGILNGVSLFVIIGIGVDDIFVFINTFRQAADNNDLANRIVHTIHVAGTATFFTSFTTAAAFGANALSPIPAIHDFGLFMAILVCSCWVSVIFIMTPALTLWHAGIEKWESLMCNRILSAIGVNRSKSLRLPADIRRFLSGITTSNDNGYESEHEEIPLQVNNNPDDIDGGDDDDVPLLVLDDESSLTATRTIYGTADAIGFRLQSILYHFVAEPVIKGRVVIFVLYLFLIAGCALFMSKLKVSKEQPKFFKTDSNLQRWLELPDVSLKSKTLIKDIQDMEETLMPTLPVNTPPPKYTQSRTRTRRRSTRKLSTRFPQQPTTIPLITRKPPATKPMKHSTREHPTHAKATKRPLTRAPTTQETEEPTTEHSKSHLETTATIRTSKTVTSRHLTTPSWVTNNGSTPTTAKPKLHCPVCANGVCNNKTLKCDCSFSYTGETCSKYCPVRTTTGDCCAIPFKYNNHWQYGCLVDRGKPWCSHTSDFDKDGIKRECNKTVERVCPIRTDTANKTCCHFPFMYNMVVYYACIPIPAKGLEGSYCGSQYHVASPDDLLLCHMPSSAPILCSKKQDCKAVPPPPTDTTALVYLVFGIKGIDKTSVDLRHVLKETEGNVLYDKDFAKDMSCSAKEMLKSACRICKKFGFNKHLVKHGECFPDVVQAALAKRFPDDCQDLPEGAKSTKIKSIVSVKRDLERGFLEVEWIAMAFSSTTGKLSSYTSQHKDYQKWQKQLEEVLADKDVPDSLKSGFHTSETWVKMFSGEIVVTSAVYGILVSLLLCLAAVIIFTGHVLLFVILFLTILGVLLMVTAIFYLTGWQLGGVEAISLSILVGTSVDYCFHLVEGYILAGEAVDPTLSNMAARQWRAKAAMSHIGMSIISSAITTILAAIPLCFTQIQLFAKFGLIVTINTSISLLYTVTVTMAMLSIFGPARFRASLGACVKGLLFVLVCIGCGVLSLYLISTKGGQCIPSPTGTPIFDCS